MAESKALAPIERMKTALTTPSVVQQFQNALAENSSLFVASLIDLYSGDTALQKCAPGLVIQEALKAATLRLPINKNLGFAWIIPRWSGKLQANIPQMQIGWKGIVQLAQRTGQYRHINCGPVLEGELRRISKLTGEVDIEGDAISEKVVGYFAYIETINGFSKASYWPKDKVEKHAIRYNQECKKAGKLTGNWLEYFDERAMATVLKHLISKYGIMSIDVAKMLSREDDTEEQAEAAADFEIEQNANKTFLEGEVIEGEIEPAPATTASKMETVATDPGF